MTAGLASGALTTSVSLSGPPLVLWFRARGLTPAEMRASLAAAFLFLNLVGAALLFAAGEDFDAFQPDVLVPLLALVVAGHLLGSWLFRRVDAERSPRWCSRWSWRVAWPAWPPGSRRPSPLGAL